MDVTILRLILYFAFICASEGCLDQSDCSPNEECDVPFTCQPLRACFPGNARVTTKSGELLMRELSIGDQVAVKSKPDLGLSDSYIYAFGHRDSSTYADFIKLTLNSTWNDTMAIELSPTHFIPAGSSHGVSYKYAKDVLVGDFVWASNSSSPVTRYTVTGVFIVVNKGLYNPLTTTGTIMVNGVLVSAHSDWFLDSWFTFMGLGHLLPYAYQIILLPIRLCHIFIGTTNFYHLVHKSVADGNNFPFVIFIATVLFPMPCGK